MQAFPGTLGRIQILQKPEAELATSLSTYSRPEDQDKQEFCVRVWPHMVGCVP